MSRSFSTFFRGRVLRVGIMPCSVMLMACSFLQLTTLAEDGLLRAFPVHNTESDAVVRILKQIFDRQDIVLISDARTNTIVVEADAVQLHRIQQIIARLDQVANKQPQALIRRIQPGHVRQIRPERGIARLRHESNVEVEVLVDGSVEIRAPQNTEYWVRKLAVHKQQRVKKNQPLILLDATNNDAQLLLRTETTRLRKHLAEAETLSRRHRDRRTEFDKQEFARAAKRATAIRAGIAEKTRQMQELRAKKGTFIVSAEITGIVTFAQTIDEYCPDGQPLAPGQLLLRIEPE